MRHFLLLCLCTLAFSTLAFGESAQTKPVWNCFLIAQLQGDGIFYLNYGRDSWNGKAKLVCDSETETRTKAVDITYNGFDPGFGVNQSSVIRFQLDLRTSSKPSNFVILAHVFNSNIDGSGIFWHSESGDSEFEVNVTSEDVPGIQHSLQQGNLFIR